jgi:hypothetical protein
VVPREVVVEVGVPFLGEGEVGVGHHQEGVVVVAGEERHLVVEGLEEEEEGGHRSLLVLYQT